MYEVTCETCGQIAVHERRSGVESRAKQHMERTDHSCTIKVLDVGTG